jgi:hypothetical protein
MVLGFGVGDRTHLVEIEHKVKLAHVVEEVVQHLGVGLGFRV